MVKTSRHEPAVLSSRSGAWVECSCGWLSPVYRGGTREASVAWAEHVLGAS